MKKILTENIDYINHLSNPNDESKINTKIWYVNGLKKVPIPDPQIFVENGVYYIVGTTDGNISVIDCFTTKDFTNFERHPAIYNPALYNGWESSNPLIFAAEMYYFNGVYYLYYSAEDDEHVRYCSVVEADNPLGPYKPIVNDEVNGLNTPVFKDLGKDLLDATMFLDDDNTLYMYLVQHSKQQHITGVKMKNPYIAIKDTYTKLIVPGYVSPLDNEQKLFWELYRNCEYKINEAPFMLKSNGKYYLTYSANGCWNKYYNVCYAVSDSPLGIYVKPYEEGKVWTNLLMGYPGDNNPESLLAKQWDGFASGTAHHSFFKIGDQLMIAYHAHQNRGWNEENWAARYVAIDYAYFDSNGVPFINGPTYSIQPLPEEIIGYKNIAKNAVIKTKNIINDDAINDDYIVKYYNLENDNKEVKICSGKSSIEFDLKGEFLVKGLMIYNSAFYNKLIRHIEYIDLGNGNLITDIRFNNFYVKEDVEFVFPNSSITLELLKEIKTSKIIIGFNLPIAGNINGIKILGK